MSHAAFLKTIRQAPDEDTARLVYADYLDEQGNPADAVRAEFIRLQVRLATLDETHPDRPALEDRGNELLRAHERAWVGKLSAPIARGLDRWRFVRGFLGSVTIDPKALANNGGPFFSRHPISRVELSSDSTSLAWETLGKRAWWANVRDLDTGDHGVSVGPAVVEPLLTSPHLTGLRRLALNGPSRREPAPTLPDVLAKCPSLPTLTELVVRDWQIDPANLLPVLEKSGIRTLRLAGGNFTLRGLKALLSSPFAERGGTLELANGTLGAPLWSALATKKALPILTRVSFSDNGRAQNLDLPTLLSAPATANLHALDVSESNLPMKGVRAISQSDFMARATELGLTRCKVGAKGVAALACAEAPHLRKLALGETGLRNEGVFALCEAPWADALTHLDLMRNYLDDQALIAMANSGRFVNLRALDLRVNSSDLGADCKCEIGDEGVIALASVPNLARLRSLNLYRTRVTVRGIEALLNSPYCRLAELELGGDYDLGADLPRVLARSPRLARLTKLALSFTTSLGGDALKPLAESPHLSPLCRLDVRYNDTSARVSAALTARLGRRFDNYPAVGTW